MEKKLYKAYEPIITQGEEGTDLFILESGSAMVQVKVNNIDSHTSKGEKTSESKDNSEALEGSDGEGSEGVSVAGVSVAGSPRSLLLSGNPNGS